MARYTYGGPGHIRYDDDVVGEARQFATGESFWAPPPGASNLPTSATGLVVDALCDHYGSMTRREFVVQADVDAVGDDYVDGSQGQVKILDEFVGIGQSEDLTGKVFKRTIFKYESSVYPTQFTSIFETTSVEGNGC